MVTPQAVSKRLNNSIGIGADPEKAVFIVEMSASTLRCISADTAVGTVMTKVIFQRSQSFQKLSITPSPRYPAGVGKTTCAPENTMAIRITWQAKTWNSGSGHMTLSVSENSSLFPNQPLKSIP